MPSFPFDNTYAQLPPHFFAEVDPTKVAAPRLLALNAPLATSLGLDPQQLATPEGVACLAGNTVPAGAKPIAMAYAGHQFGGFVPQLGDGRAILLGELVDAGGTRRDVQLKGAGPTPYSRRGDGRAAIGPVLREYLVSEAMAAMGIPTTRALAAVRTGELVHRETTRPGAVLTRIASSHVRVGTFQFFASRGDVEALRTLSDYVLRRHAPQLAAGPHPHRALLREVVARQARLVAAWQLVGFVHGVMNTDNCSVSGETLDFGPCAFLDAYDPATVFSSIDHQGRYAYGNQPRMAVWNLARLAEAMLPLLDEHPELALAEAEAAVGTFMGAYEAALLGGLRRKLGLTTEEEGDLDLAQDLLKVMGDHKADFTLTFRRLAAASEVAASTAGRVGPEADGPMRGLFEAPAAYDAWAVRWRARLSREPVPSGSRAAAMRAVSPAFIPRNHRVEAALEAAAGGDLAPFEALLSVVTRPFEDQPEHVALAEPGPRGARPYRTFCGT
jgi:uncharacterized protein YdiU (UPF0061 family)